MARKEEQNTIISDEENRQLLNILEHSMELAQQLHSSTTQAQAETVLTDITSLSEDVQMALLKALVKAQTLDAADILTALNAFSLNKEIRKEARRSLIRLDAVKLHSQWTPPIAQASAIQVNVSHTPRFWKGSITQTREEGEMQLLLFWEQGYDYSEVRILGFLLDFWAEGVKDAFADTVSKRAAEQRITDMRGKLPDVHIVDCTLAEGKRMLEEALSINTWRSIEPNKEYSNRLPTINQLIIQATDTDEDTGRSFINPDLEEQEVIVNFIGAWSLGDFGLAYDLLTESSSIRNSLTRDEWIERHRAWYSEAHPARIELGFVHERERSQSALWLPSSTVSRTPSRKDVEVGWSVELLDTPLGGTLREFPMGTAINKETNRHWFWTNYAVERTTSGWRIQQSSDEGAAIQGLSIAELQKRIKEYEDAIDAKMKQREEDFNTVMEELTWRVTQLLHFYDALIVKLPLDRHINEEAYGRAVFAGNPERIVVYLERMVQRFSENKGELLRRLGATYVGISYNYAHQQMTERETLFLELAELTLREAVETENTASSHMLLGELYLSMKRHDEAEAELRTAKSMVMTPDEEKAIEGGLGNIEMRRENVAEALPHFQRVIEIDPDYPGIWFSLGFANRNLGNFVVAEQAYKRAIEIEPTDIRPYSELTAIYMNRPDQALARSIIAQGVHANPESAHLHALYASVLSELGETRNAQRELQKAESLDASLEIVEAVRTHMNEKAKKR